MASESVVNKSKRNLKFWYLRKEMAKFKLKENPTIENKNDFEEICEVFDDFLSQYYSDYLFCLKSQGNNNFEVFLSIPKHRVKNNLLTDLISEWENQKHQQL